MIRLTGVRLSHTRIPNRLGPFAVSVCIPQGEPLVRFDVTCAIASASNELVYFAHVRIMRTSTRWSLLP